MRTMKKIVALSLVLAMALSMMASAAFKDQATINADLTADISLLVALNVFSEQGTGAGYFEPNVELTRAQVAKLVYVLKNKGNDNGATSWTGMNIFKDVETNSWYEGYVNYCASVGMIAGTGDGMFNPNGKVTAIEFAKLLLVLIGYKADVEGYTGDKWFENIVADAEEAGLFVDYELPIRGTVTREWAAKLMVNAINADKVKYVLGELENANISFAEDNLELDKEEGQIIANANLKLGTGVNGGKADVELKTEKKGTLKFNYDIDNALVGQNVVVLYKGADLENAEKIYGVSAAKDVIVEETTVDAVKYDKDNFENFVMYEDYKEIKITAKDFFGSNDPRALTLIDNDGDEKFEIGLVASVNYTEVEYINPASHIIRMVDNTYFADVKDKTTYNKINFVDTVEKGDAVKITKDLSTGKVIFNVEKLDVVTGAVTKVTSAGVATIDGETFKALEGIEALKADKTVRNYYIDGGYVVMVSDTKASNEVPTNLAIFVNAGQSDKTNVFGNADGKTDKVEVVLNDGTRAVYEYDTAKKVSKNAEDFTKFFNNGAVVADNIDTIYEYVVKDGKIALIDLDTNDDVAVPGETFVAKTDRITIDEVTYRTNEDSFFFIKDDKGTDKITDDKYTIVLASEIKNDMYLAGNNFVKMTDGFKYLVAGVLNGEIDSDSTTKVIVASAYEMETIEDETFIFVDVTKLDGTVETLKIAEEDLADVEAALSKFAEYTVDTKGVATLTAKYPVKDWKYEQGVVTFVGDDAIVLNGEDIDFADDLKIYYVDAYVDADDLAKIAVTEASSIATSNELDADEDGTKDYAKSVLFKTKTVNGVEKLSEIIVEIHGDDIWTQKQLGATTK